MTIRHDFRGKTVLVTGASYGQGRWHARCFAEAGANIVATARSTPDSEHFAETVTEVERTGAAILAVQADVRDEDAMVRAANEGAQLFGGIDIVIGNAGVIDPPGKFMDVPARAWQSTLGVNLDGAWATCRAAVPHLIANGGGSIILISSIYGLKGIPIAAHYAASKHAVVGLMRSLALELAENSIRVNSIHPTVVDTPMLETLRAPELTREENAARLMGLHALPVPWITSADVANAAMFLASDEARFITGVTLPVDAGALLK